MRDHFLVNPSQSPLVGPRKGRREADYGDPVTVESSDDQY